MKLSLIGFILGLCLLAGCRDNQARVIFDNKSTCGTISARLTNSISGEVKTASIPIGQRTEVIVDTDIYYDYVVDFTAAGRTADDYRCTAVESGKVRVPAGTSQTFTLV